MARKSLIEKNNRRKMMAQRYFKERSDLKKMIKDTRKNRQGGVSEAFHLALKLSSLPRDGSPSRHGTRCAISGRSKGCLREFGLSRMWFRKLALLGHLPGVYKGS